MSGVAQFEMKCGSSLGGETFDAKSVTAGFKRIQNKRKGVRFVSNVLQFERYGTSRYELTVYGNGGVIKGHGIVYVRMK